MNKPQTKLGKQLAKILDHKGDQFMLVSSGKEYDTFEIEISDNQTMSLLGHEYPGLAYGILINTKSSYTLSNETIADSLVRAANEANLKSTSVVVAVELHDDNRAFTLHCKTFIHLNRRAEFTSTLDRAVDLHLKEVDEIISPHFKNLNKEES